MSVRKIRKQIHFHSNQRWAVTIVILVIIGVIFHEKVSISKYIKPKFNNEEHVAIFSKLKNKSEQRKINKTKHPSKRKLTPMRFDPNKVTANKLIAMGIKEKDAKSWIKYTTKGGKFYKTGDIKKLYFMTANLYNQLESFIDISNPKKDNWTNKKYDLKTFDQQKKKSKFSTNETTYVERKTILRDSIQSENKNNDIAYKQNFKSRRNKISGGIKTDYIISINETDSTELQILKGIGPVLSSRIIKYKEQLGGFHNKNQLLEVYGVKPVLLSTIIDRLSFEGELRKIKLNTIEIDELVKHPYFDYQTAHIFINYRKQHGDYKSINDVKKIRIIKEYWLEETAPYFNYESSNR